MRTEVAASPNLWTLRFETLLQDLISRRGIAHAILAVESGDRSLQWTGAGGLANPDGTPMRADTPFFIASVDKLLTATVILKLCERGLIGLDEPIVTYLPPELIGGIHRLRGVDFTDTITVRHLLSHTSGLADWLEDRPKGGRSLLDRLLREGDMAFTISDLAREVRDRLTPHFPPQPDEARQQKVRYSDTNYILLIAIIEAVTGKALERVHEEFLFRPLMMEQTWVAGRSSPLRPARDPATLWFDTSPLEIPLLMRSTWAVYSTAADMLRFLRALIQGTVFEDPGARDLMHQRWNRFGFPGDRAAMRLPSWPIEYAMGIMRFHDPFLRLLGRLPPFLRPIYPAPAVEGHTGSTGSWLFYCRQLDVLFTGTVDEVSAGVVPYRLVPKLLSVVDRYRQI